MSWDMDFEDMDFEDMDFKEMNFRDMESNDMDLEEKRKIFEEMVGINSLRDLDDQDRIYATWILQEIIRVKQIDELSSNEIRALIEEIVYRLAIMMRINPFHKDCERQVLRTLELEMAIRDYKDSIPAIFEDYLFKDQLWDELDWRKADFLAEVIYRILKDHCKK